LSETAIRTHLPPQFVPLWIELLTIVCSQLKDIVTLVNDRGVKASIGLIEPTTKRRVGESKVDDGVAREASHRLYDGLKCIEALPAPVANILLSELLEKYDEGTEGTQVLVALDASEQPAAAVAICGAAPQMCVGVVTRHFVEPVTALHWTTVNSKHSWPVLDEVVALVNNLVGGIVGDTSSPMRDGRT
jgi:hypothetical protein